MHLQEWGSRTSDYAAAALAYDELVANVVGHAPGEIRIDLEWSTCQPILHVCDAGPGFTLDRTSFGGDANAGRGLVRVKSLVGPLSVRRRAAKNGMRVSVTLPVHRRECTGACGRPRRD